MPFLLCSFIRGANWGILRGKAGNISVKYAIKLDFIGLLIACVKKWFIIAQKSIGKKRKGLTRKRAGDRRMHGDS